jgi:peptide/nickel transport system substrate-binding protein
VSVNVIDEYTITITLEEPYAPFVENFTLGIMPKHLWGDLSIEQLPFSQFNTEPIGSGPFAIAEVERDQAGLISRYELRSFREALQKPNLAYITVRFFDNETSLRAALDRGDIRATAYLPVDQLASLPTEDYTIMTAPLPRIFGIFFNQNRSSALRDQAAREALASAIDRDTLISQTLAGYGIPTTAPIVPAPVMIHSRDASLSTTSTSTMAAAKQILQTGGWTQNSLGQWEKRIDGSPEVLRITLRTSNAPLFESVVQHVATVWRTLGVEVNVEQFEQSDLVQTVIRPRDFQALLFGLDMNRTEDLYPFWHSSQKDDPGLNVAQYTNIAVDRLLEDARQTDDATARATILNEVATRIEAETPAIMLFAPTLTYVVDASISTTPLPAIHRPSDRFVTISDWYAKTDTLWPLFTR